MSRRSRLPGLAVLLFAAILVGCAGGDAPVSDGFELRVSPEFVQGAIPGAATGVLVTIADDDESDAPVVLTASADGAQVTIERGQISEGEVAEVTVVADPATAERPLNITVTGRRGDVEQAATRSTTVFPWEDDRGVFAAQLLDLFTIWLADQQPALGIDADTEFTGSFVAPGLLVVSHYLFMSDEWEVGLSWHIMVAPDDWAEIYLRPRREAAPTLAFRLASQQAALDDGIVTISAVPPPSEVVR